MMKNNPETLEKAEELKLPLAKMLLKYFAEPNDAATRQEVTEDYVDFLSKQGLLDFVVKCDEENNTPERITANELWVDIAVQYMDDELFTHIPLRLAPAPDA